ncbi:sensor histidine kinase [Novipirellula artificiosorum]|uniref:histidine kinase n=1 Tax=Novipirellula artificiosorum TaxID=2528016 RepID=A0A5C6DZJ7_9BACT|nr:HAMP domain-containing sensor histidine kinase [Novipirellula artificiosorum]TWU42863.1 Alkaline phosphatase synthesis sensor protein PhoR [Novipirellula artificiosorum]
MFERRSLTAPITLGVVMILIVVVLTVVWILGNWLIARGEQASAPVYYTILATGSVMLAAMLAGVIAYLTLTVKAFNLNRRQSNFIDAVTHELKSPIASLKLYLQTLARRNVDEQQQKDFHRFMLEDVERLDSLINHLLDAARIERGTESMEKEPIRLDQLLAQCSSAACLRYHVPDETIEVTCEPLTVRSQPVQLEILFRNLIDNAVKYGGTPPSVKIRAETIDDHQVTVSVIDNGAGIPANQKRKVFGRFVRLGNELERSRPGTGLGLHLVRNVTKAVGGIVRIMDRQQGTGTEFVVTLGGVVPTETDLPKSEKPKS